MPSAVPPVLLYTYAKCSTCRAAEKWLSGRGVKVETKPIYQTPPTVAELRRMLAFQDGNVRRLFNTSGLQYRAFGLAQKLPAMTEAAALALLASDGRLVKRPFLLGDTFGAVGFDAVAWEKLI
jgi:arsenate reductase